MGQQTPRPPWIWFQRYAHKLAASSVVSFLCQSYENVPQTSISWTQHKVSILNSILAGLPRPLPEDAEANTHKLSYIHYLIFSKLSIWIWYCNFILRHPPHGASVSGPLIGRNSLRFQSKFKSVPQILPPIKNSSWVIGFSADTVYIQEICSDRQWTPCLKAQSIRYVTYIVEHVTKC